MKRLLLIALVLFLACEVDEVDSVKPQIQQPECNCHDDIDNDNDGFVDEQDSDCQYVVINQQLSIVNSEIMELIGDGTCDNFCSCNTINITHYFGQYCPPCVPPYIPYCTTNINQNELDSLLNRRTTLQNMRPSVPHCSMWYDFSITPCEHCDAIPQQLVYKDSTCQFEWVNSSPEQCVDCIDNDNDGLLDYDDFECPEDLIEECISDSINFCQNQCDISLNDMVQYCGHFITDSTNFVNCEDYRIDCRQSCQDVQDGGKTLDYEQCIESCDEEAQECIKIVTEMMDEFLEFCLTDAQNAYQNCTEIFYQECITQIDQICFNTYCTCDSTANN